MASTQVISRERIQMQNYAHGAMRSAMRAQEESRPITKATLKRIAGFAKRHKSRLILFVVVSIITAVLAVATPVLAGRVAEFYEAKLQRSLDRVVGIVGPLAIITIGTVVGGLIVSVMTALLSVTQLVG